MLIFKKLCRCWQFVYILMTMNSPIIIIETLLTLSLIPYKLLKIFEGIKKIVNTRVPYFELKNNF